MPQFPLDRRGLTRATVVACVLAIAGIVLFLILYFSLRDAQVAALPRLVVALCVPPAVLAVIVGWYVLWKGGKRPSSEAAPNDD